MITNGGVGKGFNFNNNAFAESDGEMFGARTGEPDAAGGGASPGQGGSGGRTREEQIFGATPEITTVGVCPRIDASQVIIDPSCFDGGMPNLERITRMQRRFANKINRKINWLWNHCGAETINSADLNNCTFVIASGAEITKIHKCINTSTFRRMIGYKPSEYDPLAITIGGTSDWSLGKPEAFPVPITNLFFDMPLNECFYEDESIYLNYEKFFNSRSTDFSSQEYMLNGKVYRIPMNLKYTLIHEFQHRGDGFLFPMSSSEKERRAWETMIRIQQCK